MGDLEEDGFKGASFDELCQICWFIARSPRVQEHHLNWLLLWVEDNKGVDPDYVLDWLLMIHQGLL